MTDIQVLDNMVLDKPEFPYERWRPVAGFDGYYEISDLGRVRSLPRVVPVRGQMPRRLHQCVLRPSVRPSDGRQHVVLCRDGKPSTRNVAGLMKAAGFR